MRKTIFFLFAALLVLITATVKVAWAKTAVFDDKFFVDSKNLPLEEDLES